MTDVGEQRGAWPQKRTQWLAAALVLAVTVVLASVHAWPFRPIPPPGKPPGLTELLLDDRLTLGFLRLALVLLALFVIASVPALAVAGRWLVGFGTAGVVADAAQEAQAEIRGLRAELERVTSESDRYHRQRNDARAAAKAYQRIAEANLD